MVGAGGEQLRSVRADPLHNLVQLGAHAIARVLACSLRLLRETLAGVLAVLGSLSRVTKN